RRSRAKLNTIRPRPRSPSLSRSPIKRPLSDARLFTTRNIVAPGHDSIVAHCGRIGAANTYPAGRQAASLFPNEGALLRSLTVVLMQIDGDLETNRIFEIPEIDYPRT